MSGDPAAIYMAGNKDYAAGLMQKEAQEKANQIRQHRSIRTH
ncbi:hypothetical protein AGMMS49531_10790 [Endomicrobiia bacterium]|nr:hypothetical protein AGMMS49531_10790 [Endomicrobiia bacterium]